MGIEKYVIRGGVEGRERLRLLSEVMGPSTRDLLAIADISPGSICLDVGCGGGDVTFELARAVGPTGRAVGVDLDETKLDIARREAEQGKLSNIVFEAQDVVEWTPNERFDVVYARFLLTHLPNPRDLVSSMGRYIRPGGVIIVEDIDYRGHFAEPACPALIRAVEFYTKQCRTVVPIPTLAPGFQGFFARLGSKMYR